MTEDLRPTKQVWIDRFEPLQTWGFVFRAENVLLGLPLVLTWSFLLGSFYLGGLIMVARGIFAIYLTLGFFVCYLFIILDYTARGYQSPPKISGDLLTTNKLRFIKSLGIISLFTSLLYTAAGSPTLLFLMSIFTLLFLPVSFCIIAIQDSFLRALNPLHWATFLRDIEFDRSVARYLISMALVAASGYSMGIDLGWFNWASVTSVVFSLILMFRCLGVVVHTHAANLGLSVRFGPEIEARQVAEANRRALAEFALSLFQKVEVHRTKEALAEYQQRLIDDRFESEDALWQMIIKWSSSDLAVLAGQGYIERLVNQRRDREAWEVMIYCFEHNQNEYHLANGDTTLKLVESAISSQQRKVSAELLRYFDKDFPFHPAAGAALLQAVELLSTDADDLSGARKLLRHIRIKYPAIARERAYQKLETALSNS